MTVTEEMYEPKAILVTGGAGFIASHVATKLVKRFPDCKVIFVTYILLYLYPGQLILSS